jgi:hypothetical protein
LFGEETHTVIHRFDCKTGSTESIRFVKILASGSLLFRVGGLEFSLLPNSAPLCAEQLDLPDGVLDHLISTETVGQLQISEALKVEMLPQPSPARASRSNECFCTGSVNSQECIETATHIDGTAFDELTARMQRSTKKLHAKAWAEDQGGWHDFSAAGFLRNGEGRLKAQLLSDNIIVLQKLGTTHQALVLPLLHAMRLHREQPKTLGIELHKLRFDFQGRRYTLALNYWCGSQSSPFMDGTGSGAHYALTNEATNEQMRFAGLSPVMAYKYGFYQGNGCAYRFDPVALWRVLHDSPDTQRPGQATATAK